MIGRLQLYALGLAALPTLTLLDLSDNFLSGPLPNDWSKATKLAYLLLGNNAFNGASCHMPVCVLVMQSIVKKYAACMHAEFQCIVVEH